MNRNVTPVYMMAKAAGSACDLACRYCYYLDKQQLYPGRPPSILRHDPELLNKKWAAPMVQPVF